MANVSFDQTQLDAIILAINNRVKISPSLILDLPAEPWNGVSNGKFSVWNSANALGVGVTEVGASTPIFSTLSYKYPTIYSSLTGTAGGTQGAIKLTSYGKTAPSARIVSTLEIACTKTSSTDGLPNGYLKFTDAKTPNAAFDFMISTSVIARYSSIGFNVVSGDLEVDTISRGIVLKSPNGTRYRLTVNDDGSLTTTGL